MTSNSRRTIRIACAALFVLALAWQQIEATRLGYAVEQSRRQEHILRGRIGALQIRLETSLSPAQLAEQARARLGMLPASPDSLRILGEPGLEPGGAPPSLLTRLMSWRGRAFAGAGRLDS